MNVMAKTDHSPPQTAFSEFDPRTNRYTLVLHACRGCMFQDVFEIESIVDGSLVMQNVYYPSFEGVRGGSNEYKFEFQKLGENFQVIIKRSRSVGPKIEISRWSFPTY